jgi:creatinine amidohydrolase
LARSEVDSFRFADLTYEEIRERAKAGAIAVVPTGCTEQQGPHLPVGFDTWFAETVSLAAATALHTTNGVPIVVLPPFRSGRCRSTATSALATST